MNATQKPPSSAGRHIVERPIQNVIGLMRHLLGNDAGVNIRVAEEIEAMTKRSLVRVVDKDGAAAIRQQLTRRVSDFAAGCRPIPHWFETAAREWCVLKIMGRVGRKRVELTVDGSGISLACGPATRLMADGLVGLVLHHAQARQDKKVASCLRLIDELNN